MELAVVVMHGLGWQRDDFAAPLKAAVSRRMQRLGHDPEVVAWQPVYWADVLEKKQLEYLQRARQQQPLRWNWLRDVVVRGLGDAAAYQYVNGPNATYVRIHDRIREKIGELYEGPLASRPVPMVVLAHSIGSHIMSSYIWDTQQDKPTGAAPDSSVFERMGWLAGMVTCGSTIPLFTFAHDPVKPIRFPGDELPARFRPKAKWRNYYDRDDVLGYPLKPINDRYAAVVDTDVEVNVGNLVEASTPLSHNAYWDDRSFTDPVADQLATLL